jgi:hypothetical protein
MATYYVSDQVKQAINDLYRLGMHKRDISKLIKMSDRYLNKHITCKRDYKHPQPELITEYIRTHKAAIESYEKTKDQMPYTSASAYLRDQGESTDRATAIKRLKSYNIDNPEALYNAWRQRYISG